MIARVLLCALFLCGMIVPVGCSSNKGQVEPPKVTHAGAPLKANKKDNTGNAE